LSRNPRNSCGFLANMASAYDELHRAYQIAVRER
jgi:hypothetical protein